MNNHYLTKRFLLLAGYLLLALAGGVIGAAELESTRFEDDIRAFEAQDRESPPPKNGILFLGSSTIKRWDLKKHFPGMPAINRGFGGSHVADSIYYAERILMPYEPRIVVFYAGDNDIGNGKSAETVFNDFRTLLKKIHEKFPETKIIFVAIKPSIKRWNLVGEMRRANQMIGELSATDARLTLLDIDTLIMGRDGKPRAELFADDGLHFSEAGYDEISDLLRPHLERDDAAGK